MLHFKVNERLEVVEISPKYPDEVRNNPKAFARQPVDGVYFRGCAWTYGAGWLDRNDISCHPSPWMLAQALAESASKLTGKVYLAEDSGPGVSPRYDVIEAPAVGDECSKGFNGDYYPVGKIVAVAKNHRYVDVEGPMGKLRFWRRKLSGAWVQSGGTWSLVPGVRDELNPHF